MHQATLELKLRVFHTYKLLPHARALQGSAVRQVQPSVLSHVTVTTTDLWPADTWREWCTTLVRCEPNRVPRRTILPLNLARSAQKRKVRQWNLKRPSAFKGPACTHRTGKRTPFTRVTGIDQARARGSSG
eukprot:4351578-Amphidinium_carterae.1